MTTPNRLYFGDCLDVMREDIPSESVDLIYLDPPFNSKRLYNAFMGGAQWVAFDDTWRWHEAVDDFHDVASQPRLAGMIEGLRMMLGEGPQLAYLSYMANRLVECHRVLKPTGSLYLHCDPTMSHYLKAVMDGIWGKRLFRNEIVWKRTPFSGSSKARAKQLPRDHDVVLLYGMGQSRVWNQPTQPYSKEYLKRFKWKDEHGYYRKTLLKTYSQETFDRLNAENRLIAPIRKGAKYSYKQYLDESSGVRQVSDVWTDINMLNPMAKERLGYPTQKPLALLDRIIQASSNEGDVVLDPFCGCGTTVHAAQNLGRRWIGIDVCVNACKVIEQRLRAHFDTIWDEVEFIGMPKTPSDAKTLADLDKFRFERWAASLVDGMEANTRQRGDGGIDGWGRIPIRKGQFVDMVSQVKGGGTGPGDVQAFNGARQQAGADLGIFTCFDERVTPRMRDAAASTGRFMEVPTVQIYTVEDYFQGRIPALPRVA